MDKIAVIGDYDSIYGFQTLGLSICPVRDAEEGKEKLRQLALECGIIYITEALAAELPEEIERYKEQVMTCHHSDTGCIRQYRSRCRGVKKTVEQAVGSDILFSQE